MITSTDLTGNSRKAWQTIRKISNDPTVSKPPCLVTANQVAHQLFVNGRGEMPTKPKCPKLSPISEDDSLLVVVVYPLPWPLLVGGVRCSRLWSTSQLLRPSGQQCSHFGGVCPQIQGRQCGAYVGAVEEMMCVVCVDVTEGA